MKTVYLIRKEDVQFKGCKQCIGDAIYDLAQGYQRAPSTGPDDMASRVGMMELAKPASRESRFGGASEGAHRKEHLEM